jgi:hypothetical protein
LLLLDSLYSTVLTPLRAQEVKRLKRLKAQKRGVKVEEDDDDLVSLPSPTHHADADDASTTEESELALVAVGAGAAATVGLRRKKTRQIAEQKKAAKLRVLQLNVRAAALRAHEENLLKKGGLTREEASKKLQSACRVWIARRELAGRAHALWMLVRPDNGKQAGKAGKRARA